MSDDPFKQRIRAVGTKAHGERQYLTLAHFLHDALGRHRLAQQRSVDAARTRLAGEILERAADDSPVPRVRFDVAAALSDFAGYESRLPSAWGFNDRLLSWLLKSGFGDSTTPAFRSICRDEGVDELMLLEGFADPRSPELGFGEPVAEAPPAGEDGAVFVGREAELEKHLQLLGIAIRQRRHYLLAGRAGVGKTRFAKALLAEAQRRWAGADAATDLRGRVQFVVFRQTDFLGSHEEVSQRLEKLYGYLQARPDMVPVIDGFEALLNPALRVHEEFTALFGGILAGSGRTLALICRSEAVGGSALVRGIQQAILPALPPAAARVVVERRLDRLLREMDPALEAEGGAAALAAQIVAVAQERYPGRFFPEVGLHLAESAVARARARVARSAAEPTRVRLDDLWQHVADEQALNPELVGRSPGEFYNNVNRGLKEDVVGQDHAVDLITGVLEMAAGRPQREPRGRFLFVGPPGVGKTELARSLARRLGYGEESFFNFNMAEYSTEMGRTRFIGSDPGYVGFGATQTLYDKVRARPSCVVLLDEVDRCHPSIQDLLLSILEGQGNDSEGNPVYFSQAVFVMTTNQGQDRVLSAYEASNGDRSLLAASFDDDELRRLILEGVRDHSEERMAESLERQLAQARQWFQAAGDDPEEQQSAIRAYLAARHVNHEFRRVESRPVLDRALLDRIDFIVPFFPIKERALLARILAKLLGVYGWEGCPPATQASILDEAMAQTESVRPLKRLIKKYRRHTLASQGATEDGSGSSKGD